MRPASEPKPHGVTVEASQVRRSTGLAGCSPAASTTSSLYEVGTVRADNADMADVFAQSIYDEHPWIEMIVVPRIRSER